MRHSIKIFAVIADLLLAGCASSQKVKVVKPGDYQLTCLQLANEFAELEKSEAEVTGKKGVTGTNVAAAVFFWPGLLFTHMDANDALGFIREREAHIAHLVNQKNCTNLAQQLQAARDSEAAKQTACKKHPDVPIYCNEDPDSAYCAGACEDIFAEDDAKSDLPSCDDDYVPSDVVGVDCQ